MGVGSPRSRRAVSSARRRRLRRAAAGAMVSRVSSEPSGMGGALRLTGWVEGGGEGERCMFVFGSGSWETKRPWDSGSGFGAGAGSMAMDSGIDAMIGGSSSSSSKPLKRGIAARRYLPRRGGSGSGSGSVSAGVGSGAGGELRRVWVNAVARNY